MKMWKVAGSIAVGAFIVAPLLPVSAEAQARTVQPGAPGEEGRVLAPGERLGMDFPTYTEADVRFMRMMIPHHAQALEMAELVPDRTDRTNLRMLAMRILASQKDEILIMERWLDERGELEPEAEADAHAGHGAHAMHGASDDHSDMPGMLSPEQMERLAGAQGLDFDRLFLQYMIEHHEGAIVMVAELFDSQGGGQEGEIYQLASHIDSDQRMEIHRMQRLLMELR